VVLDVGVVPERVGAFGGVVSKVYTAVDTEESAQFVNTANAFIVCDVETVMAEEYCVDDVVGVVPSMV
jgi:hypothetical protein